MYTEQQDLKMRGEKILITQRNMSRVFYGSHQLWHVLRLSGATILVKGLGGTPVKLARDLHPTSEVIGIEIDGEEYLTNWKPRKFITSTSTRLEKFRVKSLKVPGLPAIVAEPRRS